jgi:2-haloacid dehalogenase
MAQADSSQPPKLQGVLFDAYGTLFDVYSVGRLAEQLFPGHGEALALLWRDKQIDYTRLLTLGGRYKRFWDVTRDGLRYAAQRLKLPLNSAAEEQLMAQYNHLSAFPENLEVLQALKARGVATGILSNGDPQMLGAAVRSAGLAVWLDHLISVDAVQRFKTAPEAYALGSAALGTPTREILFVSSNCWDAIGATWFGYTTLWVNRAGLPLEQLDTTPTRTGHSLRDVLGFFPATAS